MSPRNKISRLFSIFGALAALTACSGMVGSGGGGSSAGGGPGGSQALDGGSGDGLGGTGGGDLAGSGGAVPSTQQSDPGIGGPCGMGVPFRVRVIENGFMRNCDGSLGPREEFADIGVNADGMMAKSLRLNETFDPGSGEVYDEPLDYNPKVKVDFVPEGGGYFEKHETVDTACQTDGHWLAWVTFRWGRGSDARLCAEYRLSAAAFLRSGGTDYSSAPWQSNSVPKDPEGNTLPVTFVIDRGRTAP